MKTIMSLPPIVDLPADIEEKSSQELVMQLETLFSTVTVSNIMEFSSRCDKCLIGLIAQLAWQSIPQLLTGSLTVKPGFFYYQGQTYSIIASMDLSDCLSVAIEGLEKCYRPAILSTPVEFGHFSRVELRVTNELGILNKEAMFKLIMTLYLTGYRWLLMKQEKLATGSTTTIAEKIYKVLRKHSKSDKALDSVILCAVPQGRGGNGIYLLDTQCYRSSFKRIHELKHFTRQSSFHLIAQMILHHVPYTKLCVRQSVESKQEKLISLESAKYNDIRPDLVTAEIAFYKGINEISIPIVCNENCFLVASFEADANILAEVKPMIHASQHEIESIINCNIAELRKLETLIRQSVPDQPRESVRFMQRSVPDAELQREIYMLRCLDNKTAVGDEVAMSLAKAFITKNASFAESNYQDSAHYVSKQLSMMLGINIKDSTIQKFIEYKMGDGKLPNKATTNKISWWLLRRKLKPDETLQKLQERGWMSSGEFKRLEQSMNRFQYAQYDSTLNYADFLQCFVSGLCSKRALLEKGDQTGTKCRY